MEYESTNQFLRDLNRYKHDKKFIHLIGARINETISVSSLEMIHGLEPIRGTTSHYRFKIKTEKFIYRVGIKRLKKVIWFSCADSNKKRFYKRFP